jgi:hypothetical protein
MRRYVQELNEQKMTGSVCLARIEAPTLHSPLCTVRWVSFVGKEQFGSSDIISTITINIIFEAIFKRHVSAQPRYVLTCGGTLPLRVPNKLTPDSSRRPLYRLETPAHDPGTTECATCAHKDPADYPKVPWPPPRGRARTATALALRAELKVPGHDTNVLACRGRTRSLLYRD